MGTKNTPSGIRITRPRAAGITKVIVTAKQASVKTIGASPARTKANEDKTGKSRRQPKTRL